MGNEGKNSPGVIPEDKLLLEIDRDGLVETIAQLWDDASRETNPVLREKLIEGVRKRTNALPEDVQDAIMLRSHALMGHYKSSEGSGE
jgi:hypothetical protein